MTLGDRMKDYESVPRSRLPRRIPVLARLDGKAFHTFTRGCERPYDAHLHGCMWATATALCEQVQGCRIAYVQSDEITLLLTDYDTLTTEAWFNYEVQKMCSVAASIATAAFSRAWNRGGPSALFDARFWSVPTHEVTNAFIWRQQDATRNSIQMLGQAHFSHKRLHGVDTKAMQDLLMLEKGINWNDCPTVQKRGACIVRESYEGPNGSTRTRWVVDREIPIFTQNRAYIEQHVAPRENP